jgi:PAS domain-containing protein
VQNEAVKPQESVAGEIPAFVLPGETPALARATDWAATPLGPVDGWPASLRTAVGVCLASRFPMLVAWGEELTSIYNDGYLPILGREKHPGTFAAPAEAVWAEIWPVIGPMIDSVRRSGLATWSEDLPLRIARHGILEEAYFTFSYSPVHDERGDVAGIFVAAMETTAQVLAARRLSTLSTLARDGDVPTGLGAVGVCVEAMRALETNREDLPLVALYLAGAGTERLVACAPASPEGDVFPPELDPANPPWRVTGETGTALPGALDVELPGSRPGIMLPLPGPAGTRAGHLVAGISAHRRLDEEYCGFMATVAQRIGSEIGGADAMVRERGAAEALRREQSVLAEVVARAPAGICLWWGPDHRYRLMNEHYRRMVPVGDAVGHRLVDVLPDVAPIAVPALDAVRATGRPQSYEDLPLPLSGNEALNGQRFYSFGLSAIPEEDGSPGGVLGVTVETTDAVRRRGELEEQLLGEQRIAETLQRALLPPRLPHLPGVRLAARYEAAGERFQVGGDFYDAFENVDGTWTLIVGDVQGKGPRAAALTAMARYTIRAEAAHGAGPARLIAMLNAEMCRHQGREAEFCTMVCATLSLQAGAARMAVAVAGHPAPVVLERAGGTRALESTGPLIGILAHAAWDELEVELAQGDAVVFYTDGLTEARAPEVILEPEDLARSLADSVGRSADQLVSRLAAELPASQQLRDDYAILALSLD